MAIRSSCRAARASRSGKSLRPAARAALLLLAAARLALAVPAASAKERAGSGDRSRVEKKVSRTFPAQKGIVVSLENLIGRVTLDGATGGEIRIEGTLHAGGDTEAEAKRLLDLLDVTFETTPERIVVRAKYPLHRYTTYRDPGSRAPGGFLGDLFTSRTVTRYQGKRVTITSRGGDAVTLWADFAVLLPKGTGADVRNVVGSLDAKGVEGPLTLETNSGAISATACAGAIHAETGSGAIALRDHRGDMRLETGSGEVDLAGGNGSVRAETGSGHVRLTDVGGASIEVETGSGEIELARVSGAIEASTGSGRIDGRDLTAAVRLGAETGSGDVTLSGKLGDVKEIEISTGSGDVELEMTSVPPMRLLISTGSGDIDVDLPITRLIRSRGNTFEAIIAGGGEGRASIETGSGSVTVAGAG
jgi:DUF4097 and DUF4098 domain-containing protein YvlB